MTALVPRSSLMEEVPTARATVSEGSWVNARRSHADTTEESELHNRSALMNARGARSSARTPMSAARRSRCHHLPGTPTTARRTAGRPTTDASSEYTPTRPAVATAASTSSVLLSGRQAAMRIAARTRGTVATAAIDALFWLYTWNVANEATDATDPATAPHHHLARNTSARTIAAPGRTPSQLAVSSNQSAVIGRDTITATAAWISDSPNRNPPAIASDAVA